MMILVTPKRGTGEVAAAVKPHSFIYCRNHDGSQVFAGREEPNGNLLFGISVWSPEGHNISIYGTAIRQGKNWQYSEDMQAESPADRCRLTIVPAADGALSVIADPQATCRSHGGVNTDVGTVRFPRSSYEGAVDKELDDPEAFQRAGKCIGRGD
jgi:hypothetical protein